MAQTAALFKPAQKVLDAIKAWTIKIDSEDTAISDYPLKASLIYEGMQKWGVTAPVLAETLGKPLEVVNAYLDQRIDPTLTIDFHGMPYKELDRAKVERQIKLIKQAAGITFSGGMDDAWYTHDMAQKLAIRGVDDVMDFQAHHAEYVAPAGTQVFVKYDDAGNQSYVIRYGDEENAPLYPVDKNNVEETSVGYEGEVSRKTKSPVTLDLGVDYFYSKKTGQKFPLSGDTWESAFEGKGGVYYHVKFTDTGLPVFYTQWISTNTFTDLAPIIAIAVTALTMGGGAAWIGGEILGAAGVTASPAVTTAVGSVAINTVVTGGDVTRAVANAAANLAGAEIGGQIGVTTDSVTIGKAAEIATSAAIQGKKISATSIASVLASGTKMGEDQILDFSTEPGFDTWTANDITLEDIGITLDPVSLAESLDFNEIALTNDGIDISSVAADADGTIYTQSGDYLAMPENLYAQSFYVDADGNVRSPENTIVVNRDEAMQMDSNQLAQKMADEWNSRQGQTVATDKAPDSRPAALPPAAAQTKVPTIADQAGSFDKLLKTAVSIGASVKAIANGTFKPGYATSPYGTARVQAVGVPIQRPDGSIVTNNGNGTQTIRYPNGQVQTVSTSYTGQTSLFGGISTQTLLIGGAVLLGVALLARRK